MNKTTTATPAYKIACYDDSCTGTCINICAAEQNGSYTFYTVGSCANLADNTDCINTEVFATKEQIKECHGYRPKIYENKITWNIPTQTTTVDYNYFTTNVCKDTYCIAAPNLLYTEDDNHNKTYYTYAGYYDGTNIYNTFSTTEPANCADCYILLKQPTITAELCDNLIDFTLTPTIINANETTLSSSTTPKLPDINCHIIYINAAYNYKTSNTNCDTDALKCFSCETAKNYLFYYSISANNSTINSPLINVRTSTDSTLIESQTNFVL